MVRILENAKEARLESLIRNNEYIIGIRGQGLGKRTGNKKFSVKDIKRVIFKRGEEKDGLKLFVDVNKHILVSDVKFRYKVCFYPMILFKYFYDYLTKNILDDNIPLMEEYCIKKSRGFEKDTRFCKYMRKRCSKLLESPDSILHDCDFINDYLNF